MEHNNSDRPLFPAALVLDVFFPIYFLHWSIQRNFNKEAMNQRTSFEIYHNITAFKEKDKRKRELRDCI